MMTKKTATTVIISLILAISISSAEAMYKSNIISKVIISQKDIPSGFSFGKIPGFAKKVLKNNPWMLDRSAIRKLAGRIYPGGDYNKISNIHMTVMANKRNLYGDDIVCYVILFKDNIAAKDEIKKISDFAGYNKDRVILLKKNNMVIYFHVDDTENFHLIRKLAENINIKIQDL